MRRVLRAEDVTLGDPLRSRAIALLKEGTDPAAVFHDLVRAGAGPEDADACVRELLALKAAADARDPSRLRVEASWMFVNGASKEDVIRYFESLGIAREHAAPEVEKLAAAAQQMIACEGCRAPVDVASAYFDKEGKRICTLCERRNQTGEFHQRAVQSLENERNGHLAFAAIGALTLSPRLVARSLVDASRVPSLHPSGPCPRCRSLKTYPTTALDPRFRATLPPSVAYVCGDCGAPRG